MGNKVIRSNGITPSERYLQQLCEKSFLKMWSYPGVYRDQASGNGARDGKEVCDLLVIFGNHILIFSDKYISFPDTGDIQVDWSRWVKRAVLDSAKQIYGAERWIKQHPDRIFIDSKCSQPLPLVLPDPNEVIFHRVVVAHGARESCMQYFDGGSGSLFFDSTVVGDEHISTPENTCEPFVIGQVNPQKGFIHILDDTSLDIILSTLDTIRDFSSYLEKKERVIAKVKSFSAAGEEEMLAWYLKDLNEKGEHDFIFDDDYPRIFLDEGFWKNFSVSPARQTQIEANKISYAWDAIIEKFTFHILDDSQYFQTNENINYSEKAIRFMASEPRTRRRLLIQALFDKIENTPIDEIGVRVVNSTAPNEPSYVFLLFPQQDYSKENAYRENRRKALYAYCIVTKYLNPSATDIIGFATETGNPEFRSEDLFYINGRIWSEELQEEARHYHKDLHLLETINVFQDTVYEFPSEAEYISKKKSRKRHKPKRKTPPNT